MYTYRIEQAIRAAAVLHYEQKRKGSMPYPYITHLLSVAFILQEYTDDEDVLIASLLHDTLEDTDYTEEELKSDFGERVCELVKTVTEPTEIRGKKLTWMEKKQTYANQLTKGSKEAAMIAAVDKIHNFRSMVEEYYDNHELFLKDFGKNLADRLEAYQIIANSINKRVDGPLLAEFNYVFEQFKEFIYAVQKKVKTNLK
ncbi:MAG: HD domain-containing protein [Candidatus Paceibacteria bacterium]